MTSAASAPTSQVAADDADPPWPYEQEDSERPPPLPTWECPGGLCECNTRSDDEPRHDHVLVLHDPQGKRMPGARVRVFEHGRLITEEPAKANGAGEVTVQIRSSTSTLHVEWAPSHLPRHPFMPYRRRYHVRLGDDGGLATERRLWNLGFGHARRREDNIRAYQRTYGEPETGKLHDVQSEVAARHDDGELPMFPPQAPAAGSPHATPGASSFMPATFRLAPQGAASSPEQPTEDPQGQPGSPPAANGGAQNTQGALVASAGHVWLMVGLEPARGPLSLADLTVRLSRSPDPGKAACEHGPLIQPTGPGVIHQQGAETFASYAFPDLPLGQYTAMVHIDHAQGSRNGYALGSTRLEVKMGLLTPVYVGAKVEWPILTVADPLLDLDVPVMQRRRKVLATIHHRFPQSVDLQAKKKGVRPPYDQGEYGPCYVWAAGQNNCAPINASVMKDATGHDSIYRGLRSIPIYGFAIDQNPGFVRWAEGLAPSVGDCYYLEDGAGHKEHCGIVVQSSITVGEVWLVADGGQPDRTTDFQNGPEGWRRYYNKPYTDSREAAYILPRLFHKTTGAKLGNLYLYPGATLPGGYFLPGWADITHPDVPFRAIAYDKQNSEDGYRKLRKRVLDVRDRVIQDRIRCARIEQTALLSPQPAPSSA